MLFWTSLKIAGTQTIKFQVTTLNFSQWNNFAFVNIKKSKKSSVTGPRKRNAMQSRRFRGANLFTIPQEIKSLQNF